MCACLGSPPSASPSPFLPCLGLTGTTLPLNFIQGPQPPSPPPRPPHPPLPPIPTNVTLIVASFVVLEKLDSQAEVQQALSAGSAAISANLDGYLLTLPLSFTDYTLVTDCSDAAQKSFLSTFAALLNNADCGFTVTPDQLESTCTFKYNSVSGNKKRALLQSDAPPPPASTCDSARIGVSIRYKPPFPVVSTEDKLKILKGKVQDAVMNTFGQSKTCIGETTVNSLVSIKEVVLTNTSAGRLRHRELAANTISKKECDKLVGYFQVR